MNRTQAIPYVAYALDDTGAPRNVSDMPANARLVGWQCGFEPLFVAVWSYLPGVTLDAGDAEETAADFLEERGWFSPTGPRDADYII